MSDFTQTMKDWKRMCEAHNYCYECQLDFLGDICSEILMNYEKVLNIVSQWAADHPEPKYPTWREWLIRQGLVDFKPYWSSSIPTGNTTITCLNSKVLDPIPTNIAEKLGIEPEEVE